MLRTWMGFIAASITTTGLPPSAPAQPADAVARCNAVTVPQFREKCFEAIRPQPGDMPAVAAPKTTQAPARPAPPSPEDTAIAELRQLARTGEAAPTSFEDFIVDAKLLMGRKVLMEGAYSQFGRDNDYLFKSSLDAVVAKQGSNTDKGIPLLTGDANRSARKNFLTCRNTNFWCPVMVLARVTTCQLTTIIGTRTVACLDAEDAAIYRALR